MNDDDFQIDSMELTEKQTPYPPYTGIEIDTAAVYNRDFNELLQLRRQIFHEVAENHDSVSIPDNQVTVMPESEAPMLFGIRWPHDRAADKIAAWQIWRMQRPSHFPRQAIIALVIMLFFAITLSTTTPTAQADAETIDEIAFIQVITNRGIPYTTEDAAIAAGHTICTLIRTGNQLSAVTRKIQAATGLPIDDSAYILGASVAAFCPEYQKLQYT